MLLILRLLSCFYRVNADLLLVSALALETDNAVYQREEGIILALANVLARMDVGAALANENVAGEGELAVGTLGSKALGLGITAVAGRTYALFVGEQLQVKLNHVIDLFSFKVMYWG